MKNIIKTILVHFSYLISLIKWFLIAILRENFKCYFLRDSKGKELRILANGSALSSVDVSDSYEDIDYCMLNNSCLTTMFWDVKPSLFVLADPAYFIDDYKNEMVNKTLCALGDVSWSMTLCVPFQYRKSIQLYVKNNRKISLKYYHTNPYWGWRNLSMLLYKHNFSMPSSQNVLVPCIYIGILKGYSAIKLYGANHSWTENLTVNNENRVCIRDVHFYDSGEVKSTPWKKITGTYYKMHEILSDLSLTFAAYHNLKTFADYMHVKVINMTPNSYIDAFERGGDA